MDVSTLEVNVAVKALPWGRLFSGCALAIRRLLERGGERERERRAQTATGVLLGETGNRYSRSLGSKTHAVWCLMQRAVFPRGCPLGAPRHLTTHLVPTILVVRVSRNYESSAATFDCAATVLYMYPPPPSPSSGIRRRQRSVDIGDSIRRLLAIGEVRRHRRACSRGCRSR